MTFVAVESSSEGADEIVGEVRAVRYPNGASAEFAVLVRGDMKRRGLGRALMLRMIAYSKASGVEELIGRIVPENEAMIALARRCGMEVETQPGTSVAVAHIDLRSERPESAQLF